MAGFTVIPPGFTPSLLKPQPAWLRFRTRSSYVSGAPAVPGDFLSLANGTPAPSNSIVVANFTWGTNVAYPYVAAYARSALLWTYQGISAKRLSVVLPPWSGPAPLQVPPFGACLTPSLAELRLVGRLAYSGGSGVGGGFSFSGFLISDWNSFGAGGSAVADWPDLAGNGYIGLLINRQTGACQIAVKSRAAVGRTILAALTPIAPDVPYTVDHRFYAATATTAARYVVRINNAIVAEYSFSVGGAPVYDQDSMGISAGLYGSYFDAGGNLRREDILSLDFLAGPGANDFAID